MMKNTFGKKEKLKSKKEIGNLFSHGKRISGYPVKLFYTDRKFDTDISVKASVSVSKRNFKKAVDRNRIKRLLRESYRNHKYLVKCNNDCQFSFMFLYIGKEIPDYHQISTALKKVLKKFVEKEIKN